MTEESSNKVRVMAFSATAGGAAAIHPVLSIIKMQDWNIDLFYNGPAGAVLTGKHWTPRELVLKTSEQARKFLEDEKVQGLSLVLTSATSLPTIDMTEKLLWQAARELGVPSVAVLDQWQNYALRFSGTTQDQHLVYLPDCICVMDELAAKEMVAEGIPASLIQTTGQPAFDEQFDVHSNRSMARDETRARLAATDALHFLFVAEALKKDFEGDLGYDEHQTIDVVVSVLEKLVQTDPARDILLTIKLHPENDPAKFTEHLLPDLPFKYRMITDEESAPDLIEAADIVIGMTSVMLIESILAGKPTVSLQLNAAGPSHLVATKVGAIPFVTSRQEAERIIISLASDPAFLEDHLAKQRTWDVLKPGSALRCFEVVRSCIGTSTESQENRPKGKD